MTHFSMYLIVMVYFLAIAFLGFLGYKKTKSSKDFLIGGGEMNPIVMSLSYGATFISASAIVGFGGVAATFGLGIQWLMFLNMFVGVVIAFIIFWSPHSPNWCKTTCHNICTLFRCFLQLKTHTHFYRKRNIYLYANVCRSSTPRRCFLHARSFWH